MANKRRINANYYWKIKKTRRKENKKFENEMSRVKNCKINWKKIRCGLDDEALKEIGNLLKKLELEKVEINVSK